jgi:hypothetical protein
MTDQYNPPYGRGTRDKSSLVRRTVRSPRFFGKEPIGLGQIIDSIKKERSMTNRHVSVIRLAKPFSWCDKVSPGVHSKQ